ncbi:hypothetical protein P692DRAFT_20752748 [Suillus brevipes Sb2]|nr:hypothetical protein P692DRAFT_20752748 [Suillus brevipes Sb2]
MQDTLGLAREVLDAVLWTYHKKKNKLERGIFSLHHCPPFSHIFKGSTMRKEEVQKQVTTAAARLLKSGDYLQLPDSSGLKGVISGFQETGTDKVPDLTVEQCRIHFGNLWQSVDKLLEVLECCEELEDMLDQWARTGIGDFDGYAAGSATGSDAEDINIIL